MDYTSVVRMAPSSITPKKSATPEERDSQAGEPLPVGSFPTPEEMEELGRFADRVAEGEEPLTYVKL